MANERSLIIVRAIFGVFIFGLLTVSLLTEIRWTIQLSFILFGAFMIVTLALNKIKNKAINIVYLCSAIFVIFIALYSFSVDSYKPYLDRATDLSYGVRTSLKNPNGNMVDMKNMTGNYAWDMMYILTPHTDVNEFLKKNNLQWYGDKKENIKYLDDIELLIFTFRSKVSCYAEINRSDSSIDFSEIVHQNNGIVSYKSDKAIFYIK